MKISRTTIIGLAGALALGGALAYAMPQDKGHEHTKDSTHASAECKPHTHAVGDGRTASASGLELAVNAGSFTTGEDTTLVLTITDENGAKVTDFAVAHDKKMHLIVVREVLGYFLHLHPEVDADGNWSTPVNFPAGGTWRVIADITKADLAETKVVLGSTVTVGGENPAFTLPEPTDKITVDGFDIKVSGSISATSHGMLMFSVSKDGVPVALEQYLGAGAHLVAITPEGDYEHFHPMSMAAMHVCPDGGMPVDDPAALDDAKMGMIHFMAEVPNTGTYRLFLQFQVDGKVHTAPMTAVIS